MHFGNSEGKGGKNMEAILGWIWIFFRMAQLEHADNAS